MDMCIVKGRREVTPGRRAPAASGLRGGWHFEARSVMLRVRPGTRRMYLLYGTANVSLSSELFHHQTCGTQLWLCKSRNNFISHRGRRLNKNVRAMRGRGGKRLKKKRGRGETVEMGFRGSRICGDRIRYAIRIAVSFLCRVGQKWGAVRWTSGDITSRDKTLSVRFRLYHYLIELCKLSCRGERDETNFSLVFRFGCLFY